jgi:hypothetical protein
LGHAHPSNNSSNSGSSSPQDKASGKAFLEHLPPAQLAIKALQLV